MRLICGDNVNANRTDFTVLWLADLTRNTSLILEQQEKVQSIFENLMKIDTAEDCEEFIDKALLTETIILIASEALAKKVVPCIHQQCQLATMFIYHDNEGINEQWFSKYKKIKFLKLDEIGNYIRIFQGCWLRNSCRDFLPTNIFNSQPIFTEYSSLDMNGTFLFSQLFLHILLSTKSSLNDKDKFISTCAKLYKSDTKRIEHLRKFNIGYREEEVLEWYTNDSFIFQELNKALRIQNVDFLFLSGFLIRDLIKQLEEHRCPDPARVYRGQKMSKHELSHLKKSIGQFISMNSFLSTSLDKNVALIFAGANDTNINQARDDCEYVLFEIDADPNLSGGVPAFAHIIDLSRFCEEQEILFKPGSIFRLNNIRRDSTNEYLTIVSMTLCGNDDHPLKTVFDVMKTEYQVNYAETSPDGGDPTLILLGRVLLDMGCFSLAKQFFVHMLRTMRTESESVHLATCYRYIGEVYRQKRHFRKSKRLYRKSLEIYEQLLSSDDAHVAATYMRLGHAYNKSTDWRFSAWYQTDISSWWESYLRSRWEKSLTLYNKALEIYKRIYDEDHPCSEIATCYLSLGSAYFNIRQYSLALDNYQKALNIQQKILPDLHRAFVYCHRKLRFTFFHTDQINSALLHFIKALEIGLQSLPSGHPLIIELYYVLGSIHKNLGDIKISQEYFQKQLDLLNCPRTSVASMIDVIEVSDSKIHYICPQCELPVWVYSTCRILRGKRCTRCIREMFCFRRQMHVLPIKIN